jgi:exosome complex RNA-binding protein Rrp4
MCYIIINRKREFAYSFLSYKVILNNKVIGKINSGQTKKWKVDNGDYTIFIKAGFFIKSNKLNFIINNNNENFIIENFKNGYIRTFIKIRKRCTTTYL